MRHTQEAERDVRHLVTALAVHTVTTDGQMRPADKIKLTRGDWTLYANGGPGVHFCIVHHMSEGHGTDYPMVARVCEELGASFSYDKYGENVGCLYLCDAKKIVEAAA